MRKLTRTMRILARIHAFPGLRPPGFPARLAALTMQALAPSSRPGDDHLWVIAFGLSLLANAAILVSVGFAALESAALRKNAVHPPAPPAQTVVTIFPELVESLSAPEAAPAATTAAATEGAAAVASAALLGKRFARTSADQSAPPPETPAFLGERNTRATSDRPPDPTAPPLPSQAGIAPRNDMEIETTESRYQDGSLDSSQTATPASETPPTRAATDPPTPAEPAPAKDVAALEPPDRTTDPDQVPAAPPPRESLLEGPNPVDVPVPRERAKDDEIKPTPATRPESTAPPKMADTPKPKPDRNPGFKGFQRKTAVTGSISRSGRSALDVEDSPLGRYQAALSRAVEQEWQRNCVRHRDYITPGFLTVRFFVEPGGKVRSVQFVGDMETGEVQKGFTLNSIRNAAIPAMPPALRKQYDQEPLELIFRFYF
jgi:hypothetical protein